jgi:hypothetical protein
MRDSHTAPRIGWLLILLLRRRDYDRDCGRVADRRSLRSSHHDGIGAGRGRRGGAATAASAATTSAAAAPATTTTVASTTPAAADTGG